MTTDPTPTPAEAARALATALHGDIAQAATRLDHVRTTQRAAEAARLADALEAAARPAAGG